MCVCTHMRVCDYSNLVEEESKKSWVLGAARYLLLLQSLWRGREGMQVSCGHCNKSPRIVWFATREVHCLAVLEARTLKSRCRQGCFLLETLRKNLF